MTEALNVLGRYHNIAYTTVLNPPVPLALLVTCKPPATAPSCSGIALPHTRARLAPPGLKQATDVPQNKKYGGGVGDPSQSAGAWTACIQRESWCGCALMATECFSPRYVSIHTPPPPPLKAKTYQVFVHFFVPIPLLDACHFVLLFSSHVRWIKCRSMFLRII